MDTNPPARARRTFFIDSENHINTCLQGIESLTERDLVVVFHRETNLSTKQKEAIKDSPARIEWILCQDSGVKNSLDVQLIAELSRRIACHEIENGYIVSQDQGYNPAIHYLLNRYSNEFRFIGLKKSIDEFMLTDALISSESRQDVHEALVRHAGQIVGTTMYRHIRDLFDATGDSEEPEGGYLFDGVPLFPEQAEAGSGQKAADNEANGTANGAQRKTNKRRKSRSGAKQAGSTAPGASETNGRRELPQSESGGQATVATEEPLAEQAEQATAPQPTRAKRTRGAARKTSSATPAAAEQSTSESPTNANAPKQEESEHQTKRPARQPRAKRQSSAEAEGGGSLATETPSNGASPDESTSQTPATAEPAPGGQERDQGIASLIKLPGIGKALASRLESVGVASASALKSKGSKATWVLLKKQNPTTSINWLYALEGAVRGITVKELDEETKAALKSFSKLAQ